MITNTAAAMLADRLGPLTLPQRVAAVVADLPGRIVFTTSFGLEDQALAHAVLSQDLPIEVVTLDTGRMFPETYDVWAATEARYGRRIKAFTPRHGAVEALVDAQGIDGFRRSIDMRKACCEVRKVEPLGRALAGAAAWVTGLRAGQSANRGGMAFAAVDAARGLVKVNPLLDWKRDQVAAFVAEHGVPYNVLHDQGFPSIGCAPCTRAVAPGEAERAGRWWWEAEDKKECGLHVDSAGRLTRAPAAAPSLELAD